MTLLRTSLPTETLPTARQFRISSLVKEKVLSGRKPLRAPTFNFAKVAVNIVPLDVPRVVVTSNFIQLADEQTRDLKTLLGSLNLGSTTDA